MGGVVRALTFSRVHPFRRASPSISNVRREDKAFCLSLRERSKIKRPINKGASNSLEVSANSAETESGNEQEKLISADRRPRRLINERSIFELRTPSRLPFVPPLLLLFFPLFSLFIAGSSLRLSRRNGHGQLKRV